MPCLYVVEIPVFGVEPGVHVLVGLVESVGLILVVEQSDRDERLSEIVGLVPG
jgi:hypothetical protein